VCGLLNSTCCGVDHPGNVGYLGEMVHVGSILSAFAGGASEILKKQLISQETLGLTGFFVPVGKSVTFESISGVDRLHILLKGRCRLIQGDTCLQVNEGHALGVASPGPHILEAESPGVAFIAISFFGGPSSEQGIPGGLSILELLGHDRNSARDRLESWSRHPSKGQRLSFLPLEQLPSRPNQIFPASRRYFLVLEGTLRLETPNGTQTIPNPSIATLEPDTPHRLIPASHGRTTVLAISDAESAEDIVTHMSCGHRALWCDLVHFAGDGLIQVDASGTILRRNPHAVQALGLDKTRIDESLLDKLLPKDAGWLSSRLQAPAIGEPERTIWACPHTEDRVFSILFMPYQGERQLTSAVIYIRPLVLSNRELTNQDSKPSSPVAKEFVQTEEVQLLAHNPRMVELHHSMEELATNMNWLVLWGEVGTGRSTFATMVHRMGPGHDQIYRQLDCAQHDSGAVSNLILDGSSPDGKAIPGPWLQNLSTGTLHIDHLEVLSIKEQNRILKGLSSLNESGILSGRVVVEMERRPQKGLPSLMSGSRLPRRGGFVVLEIPPLRERTEDIPILLQRFLQSALENERSYPTFAADALELLLSHDYPGNLLELNRVARALAASPIEGPIPVAAIHALLGKRPLSYLFPEEEEIPTLAQVEREVVLRALRRTHGNKAEAARRLGITRTRLYRMLVEHQIEG